MPTSVLCKTAQSMASIPYMESLEIRRDRGSYLPYSQSGTSLPYPPLAEIDIHCWYKPAMYNATRSFYNKPALRHTLQTLASS